MSSASNGVDSSKLITASCTETTTNPEKQIAGLSEAPQTSPASSMNARKAEFQSPDGVLFRAKLIGVREIEELRGRMACENAMLRLKMEASQSSSPAGETSIAMVVARRQTPHKTRVHLRLRWDAIWVHLGDGGRELLHKLPLEAISFVWKDPCDPRAFGVVCAVPASSSSSETKGKFYAYKTEKMAMPCLLALKELFGLKSGTDSIQSSSEDDKNQEETETKDDVEKVKSNQDSIEDLLNLSLVEIHPNAVTNPPVVTNLDRPQAPEWPTSLDIPSSGQATFPSPQLFVQSSPIYQPAAVMPNSWIPALNGGPVLSWSGYSPMMTTPTTAVVSTNNPFVQQCGPQFGQYGSVSFGLSELTMAAKTTAARQIQQPPGGLDDGLFSDLVPPLKPSANSENPWSQQQQPTANKKKSLQEMKADQQKQMPNLNLDVFESDQALKKQQVQLQNNNGGLMFGNKAPEFFFD